MTRVSAAEGIRYGFGLLGYSLGVAVFGLLIFAVGVVLAVESAFEIGIILILVGGVVSYAGTAGTLYKVIADAVAKGNEMTSGHTASKVADQDNQRTQTTASKLRNEN